MGGIHPWHLTFERHPKRIVSVEGLPFSNIDHLTVAERIEIIKVYYQNVDSALSDNFAHFGRRNRSIQ